MLRALMCPPGKVALTPQGARVALASSPPPQVPLSGLGLSANAAFLVLTYTFQGRRLVLLGAQDLVWCLGHPRHAGAVRRLGGSSEADRSSWGTEEETGTVTAQPSVGGATGTPSGNASPRVGTGRGVSAVHPRGGAGTGSLWQRRASLHGSREKQGEGDYRRL